MKKLLFIILLLVMFAPFVVKAESFEYQIVVDVNLENRDIKENEFTFELSDSDGNIIQTKKNSQDGRVYFDSISFTPSDVNISGCQYCMKPINHGYRLYTVKQVIENENIYTYDKDETYIGVYFYADGTSEVHYLKDIDETIEEWSYRAKRDSSKIFHATEEQLQGEAYAVYDYDTEVLTFFRDEAGKYEDNKRIGNLRYFAGFENGSNNQKWHYIYDDYRISENVKKIVFEDAIRPTDDAKVSNPLSSDYGWFQNMYSLQEVENFNLFDTSLLTSFAYLFEDDNTIKKLDLSTWDTSNVTDMQYMFYQCENLEEVYIDNFDTSKVTNFYSIFSHTKVATIDASILDVSNARRLYGMFDNSSKIKSLDFSTWNVNTTEDGSIASYCPELRYIDVSTLKGLSSNALGPSAKLSIIKFGRQYRFFGTYIGMGNSYWYDIINKQMYSTYDLQTHLGWTYDLEPSTYVRPDLNLVPSVYTNKFIGYKESNIELKINNKNESLLNLFEDIMTIQEPLEWNITNPNLLRIENNIIIPLEAGETNVSTIVDNIEYIVHVTITPADINVPDTSKNLKIGDILLLNILILILSFGIGMFIHKKRKYR